MNNRAMHNAVLVVCAIALSVAFSYSLGFAQDPPRKKPKLEDFGSSLKRLKWDPKLNAAVEDKRRKDGAPVPGEDDVVRVETSLVICDALVLDQRGQSVRGLTEKDFVLTEDGKPQEVGMFSLGDNTSVPRSIVLIIDYSGSQLPFIDTSIQAAKTLVDKLGPLDRMALVTDDVELLLDFTANKQKLKNKLESLRKRANAKLDPSEGSGPRLGRSAQYSALMATLKEAFNDEDQRPIIIFQTDGDEVSFLRNPIVVPSVPPHLPPDMQADAQRNLIRMQNAQRDKLVEFSLQDVYKAAETTRATIYTVVPGFRLLGLSPDEQLQQMKADFELRMSAQFMMVPGGRFNRVRQIEQDLWNRTPPEALRYEADQLTRVQSALAEVATLTGGWTMFLENPSQADEIYSRIFSDINRRYVIGYYPTNKEHNGKRRKVTIEVRGHPDYIVIGRKSYFAPEPE